jgi:hypothetical protein
MQRSLLTEALLNNHGMNHKYNISMKDQNIKIQKPKKVVLDTIHEIERVDGQGTSPPIDIPSSHFVKDKLSRYETMRRERIMRRLWYGV